MRNRRALQCDAEREQARELAHVAHRTARKMASRFGDRSQIAAMARNAHHHTTDAAFDARRGKCRLAGEHLRVAWNILKDVRVNVPVFEEKQRRGELGRARRMRAR